jgi:hypothetical protein
MEHGIDGAVRSQKLTSVAPRLSFRTRQCHLELTNAKHAYGRRRYTVAVRVIDISGNDMMRLVPVNVG